MNKFYLTMIILVVLAVFIWMFRYELYIVKMDENDIAGLKLDRLTGKVSYVVNVANEEFKGVVEFAEYKIIEEMWIDKRMEKKKMKQTNIEYPCKWTYTMIGSDEGAVL